MLLENVVIYLGLLCLLIFKGILVIVAKWSDILEVKIPAKKSLWFEVDFTKIWSSKEALSLANRVGFVIEGKYPLFTMLSKYWLNASRSFILSKSILKSPHKITLFWGSKISRKGESSSIKL